jgi:hypothetical protein
VFSASPEIKAETDVEVKPVTGLPVAVTLEKEEKFDAVE